MTGPPEPPDDPPPPQGWYPPTPPPPKNTGLVVGLAAAGIVVFTVFTIVFDFVVLAIASEAGNPAVVVGAVVLALVAFGGGAVLLALRRPWAKGLGLGLMIGWALVSIVTVGFCTGINPDLYGGFI